MINKNRIEKAYHSKILAEILKVEAVLGMQIFPCSESNLNKVSYGDLKTKYPAHYNIFYQLLKKIQILKTGDFLDRNTVQDYKNLILGINKITKKETYISLDSSLSIIPGLEVRSLNSLTREGVNTFRDLKECKKYIGHFYGFGRDGKNSSKTILRKFLAENFPDIRFECMK
jgi:hypothetical protein